MNYALIFSALMMGLAGTVHCVAMCGASSAAVVGVCGGGRSAWAGFHVGRVLGYAAAGALAASSVSALGELGRLSPALRPLWGLAHMAALALGIWLMFTGRQPAWLDRLGRGGLRSTAMSDGWQVVRGPGKALGMGALWVAWPCGLLQSALVVAALANGPVGGAAVMTVFALGSSVALGTVPALFVRWLGGRANLVEAGVMSWVVRLSGVALTAASAWALGHDLWMRVAAYCIS
ncbi:sulfite exporter TauE/SafE family protein [Ideonella oryzae]|uniref:Sulfite exporter TauE/SafE family protein n=1 Tax=Ideonella oryzae TaxID=2937441 RepID=A0ABT1BSV4_9BURK|nr:sulfite exporter TauE/SafE family protein [Ideonella oryzae]